MKVYLVYLKMAAWEEVGPIFKNRKDAEAYLTDLFVNHTQEDIAKWHHKGIVEFEVKETY